MCNLTPIDLQKKALRRQIISYRKGIYPADKREMDERITERVLSSDFFSNSKKILLYYSVGIEVDTLEIAKTALALHKTVYFPVCGENSSMEFYCVEDLSQLIPSAYGIPAPVPDIRNIFDKRERAMCIVPALAVDSKGYRLGYGGGYYDRFLSQTNLLTVELCYEKNKFDCLPVDRYDRKSDIIITDKTLTDLRF